MHTQGEWKYHKKQSSFQGHELKSRYIVKGRTVIAEMGGGEEAIVDANANLICAAPDMYQALKKIASCEKRADGDVVDIARKAIAKAEGR